MILELDLGNTRGKWRIVDDRAAVVARDVGAIDDWLDGRLPAAWRGVGRVRVSSVLAASVNTALAASLQRALGVAPQFAQSTAQCAGVTNVYAEPERLGVDRWLALIAAYQRYRTAVLVVDIGSALTVDVADEAGVHRGGYIVPGPRLMMEALYAGTDRVRFDAVGAETFALGTATDECVHHGIVAALCGTVLVALQAAEQCIGCRPLLVLCGGWGEPAARQLAALGVAEAEVQPDLVLDGLRWALPSID